MKKLMAAIMLLAAGSAFAQSYSEIVRDYPGAFTSQVTSFSTNVLEAPGVQSAKVTTLSKNDVVLVYDSTDVYYWVASPKKGKLGVVFKAHLMNRSEAAQVRKTNAQQVAIGTGLPGQVKTEYKINPLGFVVGAIAAGLAWDLAADAGDLDDAINAAKKANLETDKLTKSKSRKTILAIVCGVGSVASLVTAFEPVEVQVTQTGVAFNYSYKF